MSEIVACYRVGRENLLPRDEWAAKNFLVKSHFNPIAINNDWSLCTLDTEPLVRQTPIKFSRSLHLDSISVDLECQDHRSKVRVTRVKLWLMSWHVKHKAKNCVYNGSICMKVAMELCLRSVHYLRKGVGKILVDLEGEDHRSKVRVTRVKL